MDKKFEYIGFLAGFDIPDYCPTDIEDPESCYLDLDLKYGFKIRCDSLNRVTKLVSQLDNTPFEVAQEKLLRYGINSYIRIPNDHNDRYVYYFHCYFDEGEFLDMKGNFQSELKKFFYVDNVIQIMRLFKEGEIQLPLYYSFYYENEIPLNSRTGEPLTNIIFERFSLSIDELPKLEEFINTFEPSQSNFGKLQLAFENLQLSYLINFPQVQFLTLMNCMEVLFHPSNEGELRFRISRNFATLLGEDREDAYKKYKKMGDLYAKRSAIVHSGQSDVTVEDVLKLRGYVRESIKKIYQIDESKDELLRILNGTGFGEKI